MRNPFATLTPPHPPESYSTKDKEMIDAIANRVVQLGMAVPAILFIEMGKPLSYIGSQTMVFFAPIATSLFPGEGYDRMSRLMEDRDNVERLMSRIEELEDEHQTRIRNNNKKRKASQKPKRGLLGLFRSKESDSQGDS